MRDVIHFSNNLVGVIYDIDSNTFLPMNKDDCAKVIKNAEQYIQLIDEKFTKKNKLEIVPIKSFKITNVIDQIKIIVQNGCNLKCKYCYANGATYNFE